ncbi:MAG: response regulator, partial [Magnetococcales bacterium]|nr:response regulator [Magnetococcales bacterium]
EIELIFMDLQMPILDGFEATKYLLDDPDTMNIPIVAMTAHAMSGDRDRCLGAGMSDYVSKPIELEQLYACIKKWIKPRKIKESESQPTDKNRGEDLILPDYLPGIDINNGLTRVTGNKRLLQDLLISFKKVNASILDKIREALDKENRKEALRLVHSIKGTSGNIGALELSTSAKELEVTIKEGDDNSIDVALKSFAAYLQPVFKSAKLLEDNLVLQKYSIKPQKIGELDLPLLIQLMADLKHSLIANDMVAKKQFTTLQKHLYGHGFKEEVENLQGDINNLDFSNALQSLTILADKFGKGSEL